MVNLKNNHLFRSSKREREAFTVPRDSETLEEKKRYGVSGGGGGGVRCFRRRRPPWLSNLGGITVAAGWG